MATRYSKVERRVWRDERVRKLSRPEPNARELWMHLLTCDSHGGFPGLFLLRLAAAADDLQWPVEGVREKLAEIEAAGMAVWDAETSVVWLPKAVVKHAEKLSPANAKGWRNAWEELPDSPPTRAAFHAALDALAAYEDASKAPALVASFLGNRRPEWFIEGANTAPRGPLTPPTSTPNAPHEAPTRPPRTPVELGQGEDREKDREREQPPEGASPPPRPIEAEPDRIARELFEGRDLYGPPHVTDAQIRAAAERIARAIADEPAAKHEVPANLTREAVSMGRSHKGRFPVATAEQVFAKVEEFVVRNLLGDCRSGRRKPSGVVPTDRDTRTWDQRRRDTERDARIAALPDDDDPMRFRPEDVR